MLPMLKNRSVKLSFVKDQQSDEETQMPNIDVEKIEEITRRSVLDVTKLSVAAVGTLMILHTTLDIAASHLKKD